MGRRSSKQGRQRKPLPYELQPSRLRGARDDEPQWVERTLDDAMREAVDEAVDGDSDDGGDGERNPGQQP